MASESKYLSTQTSILIAGVLIAGGLYFGLRSRDPAPAPPASALPAAQPPASSPVAATPPPSPVPPPAPAVQADRAAAEAAVAKIFEEHRAEIAKKCVEPALAKKPDPPRVKLTFNITFGPDGKQITRGVVEDRETSREGVSMCVMDALPQQLVIPAQGTSVYIEIPWVLP
ncbi:MAG: hypothetical protein R3B70_42730 [Polyangiaceae bacterium]